MTKLEITTRLTELVSEMTAVEEQVSAMRSETELLIEKLQSAEE